MGEYARRKYDEVDIKVGTCESMYYLRYTQRNDVVFRSPCPIDALWFRLPRPEENGILAGDFEFHGYMGAKPLPIVFKTDEEGNTSAEVEAHATEVKQYCLESPRNIASEKRQDWRRLQCSLLPRAHGRTSQRDVLQWVSRQYAWSLCRRHPRRRAFCAHRVHCLPTACLPHFARRT